MSRLKDPLFNPYEETAKSNIIEETASVKKVKVGPHNQKFEAYFDPSDRVCFPIFDKGSD